VQWIAGIFFYFREFPAVQKFTQQMKHILAIYNSTNIDGRRTTAKCRKKASFHGCTLIAVSHTSLWWLCCLITNTYIVSVYIVFDRFWMRFQALPVVVGARRWYHWFIIWNFILMLYTDLTHSLHVYWDYRHQSAKLLITPFIFFHI